MLNSGHGNAQEPLAATHVDEKSLLIELAILEYFLDQSIVLRLNNLYPADPFLGERERDASLQCAYHHSQTVQCTQNYMR